MTGNGEDAGGNRGGRGGGNRRGGRGAGGGGGRSSHAHAHGQVVNREGALSRQEQKSLQPHHKVDMNKYNKMISAAQDNFADIVITGPTVLECTICCKQADIFGVAKCRHPVCIECAVRLRVLSKQNSCPVCRGDAEMMYFVFASSDMATFQLNFPLLRHPDEDRYKIRFENEVVQRRYDKYLAHVCRLCKTTDEGDRVTFGSFVGLRQHMQQIHKLSYCHICTDNLSLYSRERKAYAPDQLSRHMRIGDYDDKSQKGHPTCLFCPSRFFDEEQRYKHLRKDHFYCQFCEAQGISTNVFYKNHSELITHYSESHYLCENAECKRMGIAFSEELDLKIHWSREHGGKGQNLSLDFQFSDRQLGRAQNSSRGGRGRGDSHGSSSGRGRGRGAEQPAYAPPVQSPRGAGVAVVPADPPAQARDMSDFVVVPSASAQQRGAIRYGRTGGFSASASTSDFPSLGGSRSGPPPSSAFPSLSGVRAAPRVVDSFPSLSNSTSVPTRLNEQWGRHTGGFELIDDDERRAVAQASSQHSAQQNSTAPAAQQKKNTVSKKKGERFAIEEAFPSLAPAPYIPPAPLTQNASWADRGAKAVTSLYVPANYKPPEPKARDQIRPVTAPAWSAAGASARTSGTSSTSTSKPQVQPKSVNVVVEKGKKNKKNKQQAASSSASASRPTPVPSYVALPARPRTPSPPPVVRRQPSPPRYAEPVKEEEDWNDVPLTKSKAPKAIKSLIVGSMVPDNYAGRLPDSSEDEIPSDDEKYKKAAEAKKKNKTASSANGSTANKKENKAKATVTSNSNNNKTKSVGENENKSASVDADETNRGSILGSFSFTGMLSSLASMTAPWSGTAENQNQRSETGSIQQKTETQKDSQRVNTPPPPSSSSPPAAATSSPTSPTISFAPPPGFENKAMKPMESTPSAGTERSAVPSFAGVPVLSLADIEAKLEKKNKPADGWETKNGGKKKNNRRK